MREEIIEVLREIVYRKEDIAVDTKLDTVISDSMEIIELVAVLSNRYGVSVRPKEMDRIRTVGDLIAYVEEHRSEREPTY